MFASIHRYGLGLPDVTQHEDLHVITWHETPGDVSLGFSQSELVQFYNVLGAHLREIGAIPPVELTAESLERVG